ncbi:MAG: M48 family metallopeptidase [Treponema sp.]|nr:M48 family metallopeptidase [Treponema sp.]
MKTKKRWIAPLAAALVLGLCGCSPEPASEKGGSANPFTGKRGLALIPQESLYEESFAAYRRVIEESVVVTGTAQAELVRRVGERLRAATERWAAASGTPEYLEDFQWEYNLIEEDVPNAWCMPGGKIAVLTGILPLTENEDGLAVVLGHEIAHALLNHGQRRASAGILQKLGALGVQVAVTIDQMKKNNPNAIRNGQTAADVFTGATTLLGTLPYSRSHETEADKTGLTLMLIAGYNGDEAPAFWERMARREGGGEPESPGLEFFSTHPSDERRIADLKKELPAARESAALVLNGPKTVE